MTATTASATYPDIPDQQRFTIGEASELCKVKAHVLRYWEKIYPSLRRVKRRNNQRYYSVEDLLTIRTINHRQVPRGRQQGDQLQDAAGRSG